MNAASGIATTINGIISQFSQNIIVAFNPQIIKNYSKGNYEQMNRLIINAAKYSLLFLLIISVPIEFEMPQVLKLWLGVVPEYTVIFARLSLLLLLTAFSKPLYTGLMATGEIEGFSYSQGLLYLISPFVAFFVCSIFNRPEVAYVIVLIVQFVVAVLTIFFFKKHFPVFAVRLFFRVMLSDVLLPTFLSFLLLFLVHLVLEENVIRLLVSTTLSTFIFVFYSYHRMDKLTKLLIIKKVSALFS